MIDIFLFYSLTESPPAFACHKTESHTIEGRITYNGCNVRTKGMDENSGIFTVNVSIKTQEILVFSSYCRIWSFHLSF